MPVSFSLLDRRMLWEGLPGAAYDLVVIGGGITGAGVAWDAASRGLSVLLVERGDFASGTSSKSSKLLHGGLRYLEQGELPLVAESLAQRNSLFGDAPHLARPLPFLIPFRRGGKDKLWLVNLGLWVYDALSALSDRSRTRRHRRLSPRAALEAEPALKAEGLEGALLYGDGVTEDARMVFETLRTALGAGAKVLGRAEVTGFTKDERGKLTGVRLKDALAPGAPEAVVKAGAVVNVAGPWCDAVRRLEDPAAKPLLRPTKGTHLLVAARLTEHALVIRSKGGLKERKPRMLFAVPWEGRTLLGTTDTDPEGAPADWRYLDADAEATAQEVDYILQAANEVFRARLGPEDVLGSFAGWRPLIAPAEAGVSESATSREHQIFVSPGGLVTMAGGKYTGFRTMARQTVDRVLAELGRHAPGSAVEHAPLVGRPEDGDLAACAARLRAAHPALPAEFVAAAVARYGAEASALAAIASADPTAAEPLPGLSEPRRLYGAEVDFFVRHEAAAALEDVLARRTRVLVVAADGGLGVAPAAAARMAAALGELGLLTPEERGPWAEAELARYRAHVAAARARREAAPDRASREAG